MTIHEALAFLRQQQPLPGDETLSAALIDEYDQVRRFLLGHPDPECIPLLLGSFGDGSGFGVYQLVEDVLLPFPPSEVARHLARALGSPHRGVRYWCAQIAATFPDPCLVSPLAALLADPSSDIRGAAAVALAQVGGSEVRKILATAAETETDGFTREVIREARTS